MSWWDVPSVLHHWDEMLEIWIEFAVVVEKLELWIVLLLRLKHDFHLCSLFADECRRLLDYRVYLHRPRLFANTEQRNISISKRHRYELGAVRFIYTSIIQHCFPATPFQRNIRKILVALKKEKTVWRAGDIPCAILSRTLNMDDINNYNPTNTQWKSMAKSGRLPNALVSLT